MRLALPLLWVSVLAIGASAQVIPLTHKQLCDNSDHVVQGRVTSMTCLWDGPLIVTDIEIAVQADLKGTAPKTVTIRQPGGTIGKKSLRVSASASFRTHQDVLVFLKKDGDHYRVFGCYRGKYTLVDGDVRELKQTTVPALVKELKTLIKG